MKTAYKFIVYFILFIILPIGGIYVASFAYDKIQLNNVKNTIEGDWVYKKEIITFDFNESGDKVLLKSPDNWQISGSINRFMYLDKSGNWLLYITFDEAIKNGSVTKILRKDVWQVSLKDVPLLRKENTVPESRNTVSLHLVDRMVTLESYNFLENRGKDKIKNYFKEENKKNGSVKIYPEFNREGRLITLYKLKQAVFTERDFKPNAYVYFDSQNLGYYVSMLFVPESAELFSKITGEHKGEMLAIVTDEEVIMAPQIKDKIETRAVQVG